MRERLKVDLSEEVINYLWENDIVSPEVEFLKPGKLSVPDSPGIGYEINKQVLDGYLVESESILKEKSIY
ncbi:hypothetical protein [Cytobacillus oceanisediminis]|uniref:Enolase-like protein n=1 Tax=Cytobacillus oceanisediminis TaxID=665099 RepID=A0ABX3CMQ5_9BACI|nr:hypothetical protein [Cytobacillus oceanisediminis]OHX44773.1 hypothetical protein BBV17_25040 [Cytobacillus oceanisediminis]